MIGSVDVLNYPMTSLTYFFNVKDGVTIKDLKSASKHNPLNLATTLHYVKALIDDPIWKPQEITIITPYWEQASRYRIALGKTGLSSVKVPMDVFNVKLTHKRDIKISIIQNVNMINVRAKVMMSETFKI